MRRICTGLRIKLLFLLSPIAAFAQLNHQDSLAFYNHLVSNNLQLEQLSFNKEWMQNHPGNRIVNDSVRLNNSLLYYKLNLPDSALSNLYLISPTPSFNVKQEHYYFSLSVLLGDSIVMLKGERLLANSGQSQYSERLETIKEKYNNPPHHSMFVAGFCSAILPSSGKLYLGYKFQALTAFISNTLLAGQTAESYFRAGPGSGRFIISASLFGLFYGGNILGSIILAHKQRYDYFKQRDHEIFDFHNTVVGKRDY